MRMGEHSGFALMFTLLQAHRQVVAKAGLVDPQYFAQHRKAVCAKHQYAMAGLGT